MAELTTIARPYAEAAFRIARDENALPAWSEMLRFASTQVALRQHQEAGLLERLEQLVVLCKQLIQQPVELGWGGQLP